MTEAKKARHDAKLLMASLVYACHSREKLIQLVDAQAGDA